jgi:hypothetical protein
MVGVNGAALSTPTLPSPASAVDSQIVRWAHLNIPSPPLGAERLGEVGDSRALADTHLPLPHLRRGPLPLPPQAGGEGRIPQRINTAPETV